MKRLTVSLSVLLLSAAAATAADDPIAVRKALMQASAASAGASGAMLKGELDYNPTVAKAAIANFFAVSQALGDFYPEGSHEGDTTASPRIWEDAEGFQQAIEKFRTDAAAAMEASGREGPADLVTFQQVVVPVLSNCSGCHENFRVQD